MNQKILIKSVQVKNFRSIRSETIKASSFNIFVGLNDVGKSNFLKALNLFFNGQTDYNTAFDFKKDFSYLFPMTSNNTREIKIVIKFYIPPAFKDSGTYTWEKTWRTNNYTNERIMGPDKKPPAPRSKVPNALRNIKYRYVPAVKSTDYYKSLLSDLYVTTSQSLNSPLKESTEKFSYALRDYTNDIGKHTKELLGMNSELSFPENLNNIFRSLIFKTSADDVDIELGYRGDGIQARHIPIILKYIADEDQNTRNQGTTKISTIWGYEEPENGVELSKAFEMANEFSEYSDVIQMFVTTHSPAFYLKKNDVKSTIYYVEKGEGKTGSKYSQSDEISTKMGLMPFIAQLINEKRDEFNTITNIMNEKVLFDIDTILVEGVTDKEYLELAIRRYSPELYGL